jgi:plasmid stability protein
MRGKIEAMPTLQIRDLPDDIYRRLAKAAERERRSLAQQAVVVLSQGLDLAERQERRRRIFEEASKIDRSIMENMPNPVDLIREDRDR